jgi:spore coat protein U-like protein
LAALAALTSSSTWAGGRAICGLSATPIVFGRYDPSANTHSDSTATIIVSCATSGNEPAPIDGTITLTGAAGASGRLMASGAFRVRYGLYIDPARTTPWDRAALSFSGAASRSTPFRQSFTVYGRLPARQADVGVGNYSDQIAAILKY